MLRRINLRLCMGCGAMLLASALVGRLIGGMGAPSLEAQIQNWQPLSQSAAASTATPRAATPTPRAPSATSGSRRTPPPAALPQPTAAPTTLPTAVPTDAPLSPAASETPVELYTVQRGDLLYRIAQQFNTSTTAIIELNPEINPESLTVGQVLRVPASQ